MRRGHQHQPATSKIAIASWLSRDPLGEYGGLDLYGYCGDSPVNFVDSDGRCPAAAAIPIIAGGGEGIAIGAGTTLAGGIGIAGFIGFGGGVVINRVTNNAIPNFLGNLINPVQWNADDGTPCTNAAQNKQFGDAIRAIEQKIGRKLSPGERRELHDAISGQDLGYGDIVDTGIDLFGAGGGSCPSG
jgi:hypothetical protein